MKRILVVGAVAVLLAGCATTDPRNYRTTSLRSDQTGVVEATIRNSLRDPESARFSNIAAVSGPDGLIVCGYVNSKNGFGGYSGNGAFAGTLNNGAFKIRGIDEAGYIGIATVCRNYGIALP